MDLGAMHGAMDLSAMHARKNGPRIFFPLFSLSLLFARPPVLALAPPPARRAAGDGS
jgi:hypothetical protein